MENNVNEIILHNEDHVDKPCYENRAVLRELNSNKNEQQSSATEKIFGEKSLNSDAIPTTFVQAIRGDVPNKCAAPVDLDLEGFISDVGSSSFLQHQNKTALIPNRTVDVNNTSCRVINERSRKIHVIETNDSVESIYTDCNMNQNTSNFSYAKFEEHGNVHDSFAYEPMDVDESIIQEIDNFCIPSSTVFVEEFHTSTNMISLNESQTAMSTSNHSETKSAKFPVDDKSGGDHLCSNATYGNSFLSNEDSSSFASSKSFVSRSPVFPVSTKVTNANVFPNSTNSKCLFDDYNKQVPYDLSLNQMAEEYIQKFEKDKQEQECMKNLEQNNENYEEHNDDNKLTSLKIFPTKEEKSINSFTDLCQLNKEQNEASPNISEKSNPTLISKSESEQLLKSNETESLDGELIATASQEKLEEKYEPKVEKLPEHYENLENSLNEKQQNNASFTVTEHLNFEKPSENEIEILESRDVSITNQNLEKTMLIDDTNKYSEFTKIIQQHELMQQDIKALELDKIISEEDILIAAMQNTDSKISTDHSETTESPQMPKEVANEFEIQTILKSESIENEILNSEMVNEQSMSLIAIDLPTIYKNDTTIEKEQEMQDHLESQPSENSEMAIDFPVINEKATAAEKEPQKQDISKSELAANSEMSLNFPVINQNVTSTENTQEIQNISMSNIAENSEIVYKQSSSSMAIDFSEISQEGTTMEKENQKQENSVMSLNSPPINPNARTTAKDQEIQEMFKCDIAEHSESASSMAIDSPAINLNATTTAKELETQDILKPELADISEMVHKHSMSSMAINQKGITSEMEPQEQDILKSKLTENSEMVNKHTAISLSTEYLNTTENENPAPIATDHGIQKNLVSETVPPINIEFAPIYQKPLAMANESFNQFEASNNASPPNTASTVEQLEQRINIEEYFNNQMSTGCSTNMFTSENEFKTPFPLPPSKTQNKVESNDFSDADFRDNIILDPSDFDYLLTKGNSSVPVNRNSLLLRFDPLLGAVLPVNSKTQRLGDVSSAKQSNRHSNQEVLLEADEEHNQHKSINNKTDKFDIKNSNSLDKCRTQFTQSSQKNISMSVDLVNDLEFSAKEKNQAADIKSLQTTEQQYNNMMDDIENKIKNEVLKTEDVEKKLKDAELREEALIKRITEKDKMLNKVNGVIEAYEKAIAELVAEKEQIVQNYEKQLAEARADRDSNYRHLTSLETTFSDLHVKYEKSKEMTQHLQANTEVLVEEKRQALENLGLQEQRYLKMKNHAMQQLEIANKKLESLTKEHSVEITKLKALLKKEEISRASINEQLQQKSRENNELMKICDELINGQGS